MPTDTTVYRAYTASVRIDIDAALERYTSYDADCPPSLRAAIRYSLLAPGKRLRPLLVVLAAEVCGGDRTQALPAACAVEMVHTYSLIHDDLPAMDDDQLRRGQPTCHVKFGEALAILAGDALLAQAFEVLATDIQPPDVAARCCQALAQAAGATALVGGQVDDLDEARLAGCDLPLLERIHHRKTGAMLRASLQLGGLVAQANPVQLRALAAYGQKLGLAFQIVDDLLDVQGDPATLGKTVGKDQRQGKPTFPTLLGIAASRQRATQLVREAQDALETFGEQAGYLASLANYVLERDH